jgi:CRP/FNR family transcriptional regulator, nitrogen fixation regulation protein
MVENDASLVRLTLETPMPKHLRAVAPMAGRTDWQDALPTLGAMSHFAQDREIYGEGDAAEIFFKVVAGVVRTCKFHSDGRRHIDAFYVAHDVFGFEAGSQYRLSAEAVCDCTLISFRRSGLESLAAQNDALTRQLFSYAMRSMARAQDHSLLLGRKNAIEKVAAFLLELAQQSPGAQTVALTMTRRDIADYLGLTIETVSRMLAQLERDAVIELPSARQIRFKNPTALHELNS